MLRLKEGEAGVLYLASDYADVLWESLVKGP